MAVSFQIDGSTMPYDPQSVDWDPVDVVGRKHGGGPLVNVKRSVKLGFDGLTYTDFGTLAAKCDTAAHSIKVPHPDTGTYTTFATAYLHLIRFPMLDINVYNIEIVADFITV